MTLRISHFLFLWIALIAAGARAQTGATSNAAAWVERYCATSHFIFLDYYSALVGSHGQMKEGVSDDGVHPNEKGYALLKPLAQKAIADALKQRAAGSPASARDPGHRP